MLLLCNLASSVACYSTCRADRKGALQYVDKTTCRSLNSVARYPYLAIQCALGNVTIVTSRYLANEAKGNGLSHVGVLLFYFFEEIPLRHFWHDILSHKFRNTLPWKFSFLLRKVKAARRRADIHCIHSSHNGIYKLSCHPIKLEVMFLCI